MLSTLIGGDHHGKRVFHEDGMEVIFMPPDIGPLRLLDDSNTVLDDEAVTVVSYTRRNLCRDRKELQVFALAEMTDKEVIAAIERG